MLTELPWLMMEAVSSSETMASVYQTTQCNIPEDYMPMFWRNILSPFLGLRETTQKTIIFRGKKTFVYILIFMFLDSILEGKMF
jgi:hypothetical protein